MLNIVQHGDVFELRIDNQSFQHMYHQDRTKRAFTYDGEEESASKAYDQGAGVENPYARERLGLEGQPKKQEEDAGYGGYKKGHGVSADWINRNNSWQSEQRERREEEADINDLWKPTKSASVKENKASYDDYSKKVDDMMSFESKPATQPKQFDFNAMGVTEQEATGHIVKKA